jgi:PD-(D/E)XK nuclease superfamily
MGRYLVNQKECGLEQLMADHRLVELCELLRIGDEVLDVISLTENQHSDILAWMLDAREGHGQGAEILRDLLVSASTRAASHDCGLDRRGVTARFFAAWPPSRIRTTSFGAAFVARELGMIAGERVDLFVIDPQNKFVLLVENKAGANHTKKQLENYQNSFKQLIALNARLSDYDYACIALDREYDEEATDERPAASAWLHLGYEWLKTSAARALMHVKRGNAAASLVVSYCNRQTSWESPDGERSLNLAAALHESHPSAVKSLISLSRGRAEREWLKNSGAEDAYSLFMLQNQGAIALLREMQGMASVKAALLAKLPGLEQANIEHKRAWLDICPVGWQIFKGDHWWPVFLNVVYSDLNRTAFNLSICWNQDNALTEAQGADLRRILALVEPQFRKHPKSRWRRVVVARGQNLMELCVGVAALNEALTHALKSHPVP